MNSINEFKVVGTVAGEPIYRASKEGVATAWYKVETVTEKTVNGQKTSFKSYVPIQTYGRQAEKDRQTIAVGAVVEIKGSIQPWRKQMDNGSSKYGVNIVGEEVTVISGGQNLVQPNPKEWVAAYVAAEKVEA